MSGSRRRSSLLDEMAMVAASQRLIEMELGTSDEDDEDDFDSDVLDDEDEMLEDVEEEDDYDLQKEEEEDEEEETVEALRRGDNGHVGGADTEEEEEVDYEYGPTFEEDVASLSHVGSEELDRFDLDQTVPTEYSWNPRASRILEESAVSEFSAPLAGEGPGGVTSADNNNSADISHLEYGRSSPFGQSAMRRASHAESEGSFNSAPARADDNTDHTQTFELRASQKRRSLSISVPNAEGAALSRRTSQRRTSVNIQQPYPTGAMSAVSASSSVSNDDEATETSSNSGILNSIRIRRRSTRRQNLSVMQGNTPGYGNLDNAIASLRNQDSNNEWENVAAAAAVVAAGSQGVTSKSRHIQFAVNDSVLVFLTLLNVTNEEDPKDTFTVAPVNKFGYPVGEGYTEQEKSGPYSFVLATVAHVHFDEDDRYYTIIRADTGTEQRAESGKL